MGRPIPPLPVVLHNNAIIIGLVHGILTASVLYTTLAFVFFLCGPRSRKSSLPPPSAPPKSSPSPSTTQPESSSPPPPQKPSPSSSSPKASSLPPARSMVITHVKSDKEPTVSINGTDHKAGAGGGRRLMISLSQKLTRSWTLKKEAHRERGKSASTTFDEGDLIWKKRIILGERCRVPADGGEDDDEVVVYDEHGLRIAPYHPRTPRSLPISRTTSVIDMSAVKFT
ncbi:unnamed protein product [Victoria cruziana]